MNVRTLLASAALCGAVLFCCGRANAGGFIFGYAGGATFKGEVWGYGYGMYGYDWGSYGYGGYGSGCGGYGCGPAGCDSGKCGGGKLFGGKKAGGDCSSCKTKRLGRGKGCDSGCDFGCDDCHAGAPVDGVMPMAPEPKKALPLAPNEASVGRGAFRAVAHEQIENPSFADGWLAYRKGNFRLAHETLSAVVASEPHNAAAHYGLALSHLQLGDRGAADAALALAVVVEAEHPIAGYGKLMERVQGRERLWLEAARR